MYIKSADNTGLPTLKTYEYKEIESEKSAPIPSIDMDKYVTREELEAIIAKIKPKMKKVIELEDDDE